jgi:beta-aspartyl-peptidase (threonine type)
MKIKVLLFIILLTSLFVVNGTDKYALVIHGGAGNMSRKNLSPDKEILYREKLEEALTKGNAMLSEGAKATEVVVEVIAILEDSPLFNAGKGAVFTSEGKIELDASIMEGKEMKAGAIAGVRDIKNPIKAAREVMFNSENVFLSGKGASQFAKIRGLELVPNKYFHTRERYEALKKAKKRKREMNNPEKLGTVGCVALDTEGNICAGTSTGGMNNKEFGRIGDAPVIGAGTYARNSTCGVSCTGHGEFFIRLSVAHDVSAQMEYINLSVTDACRATLSKLTKIKGNGGIIALDQNGNIAMEFNTAGMFRGYIKSNGEKKIAIFENE